MHIEIKYMLSSSSKCENKGNYNLATITFIANYVGKFRVFGYIYIYTYNNSLNFCCRCKARCCASKAVYSTTFLYIYFELNHVSYYYIKQVKLCYAVVQYVYSAHCAKIFYSLKSSVTRPSLYSV